MTASAWIVGALAFLVGYHSRGALTVRHERKAMDDGARIERQLEDLCDRARANTGRHPASVRVPPSYWSALWAVARRRYDAATMRIGDAEVIACPSLVTYAAAVDDAGMLLDVEFLDSSREPVPQRPAWIAAVLRTWDRLRGRWA